MQIARGLKLPGCDDPEADILRLVKNSLEKPDSRDWLMIIDNADDMSVLDGSSEAESYVLLNHIPENIAGSILYTTRSKKNALQLTGEGKVIQISEMSMADSKSLFRSKIGVNTLEEDSWIDLLESLERLPLAIVQAASYIRQNSWPVSKYLRHFQSHDGNASMEFLQHDFRDKTREHTVANPLFKTWMITVRQLEDQHPRAAEALWLMAFFNRQNIPRYLLLQPTRRPPSDLVAAGRRYNAQIAPDNQSEEDAELSLDLAIGTLVAYSFINISDTERGENYTIHRLVQKFTRYWLKEHRRTADLWATKSLVSVAKEFPSFGFRNLPKTTELLPHIEVILSYQPASHLPANELGVILTSVAYDLWMKRQYQLAEEHIRRALTTLTTDLGADENVKLEAHICLAHICNSTGRFQEAEDTYRMLIRSNSDALGGNHEIVLRTTSLLSNALRQQKRYKEAEELAQKAVLGLEKLDGLNVDILLDSKGILASILGDTRQYKESILIQRELCEIARKEYGPEHPKSVRVQHDLAVTLSRVGEAEEARLVSQEVLRSNERFFGSDHPNTINVVYILAYISLTEGDYVKSEEYHRRCLEHYLRYPGHGDKDTINCLLGLAECLKQQNSYDEAATCYRQAYDRMQNAPGVNEVDKDEVLNSLDRLSRLQDSDIDASEKSRESK